MEHTDPDTPPPPDPSAPFGWIRSGWNDPAWLPAMDPTALQRFDPSQMEPYDETLDIPFWASSEDEPTEPSEPTEPAGRPSAPTAGLEPSAGVVRLLAAILAEVRALRPAFFTTAQFAERSGVRVDTVRRWVRTGTIEAVKRGGAGQSRLLIPASEVTRLLREGRVVDLGVFGPDGRAEHTDIPSP